MTPFEKFMLQARGRNPDLEEKLRAEKFRNLDRYFQIVFGRPLSPEESGRAEGIASALSTGVDDEYVMQIFVAGQNLVASLELTKEVAAAKEVIVHANDQQVKLYAKQSARDSYLIWICFVLVLASLTSNAWIAGTLLHLSERVDVIGSATKR